jgi:hypothetical protein
MMLGALPLAAQAPPGAPDPLMSLMLSQPKIDITSPIVVTAAFDPPIIAPGGKATYRVTVSALEASIDWPTTLSAARELELRPGGRGQILQPGLTNLLPRTTFLYHAAPKSAGRFTIPDFEIKAYGRPVSIPSATLEVVAGATVTPPENPGLRLEVPATNLFVGQPLRVRLIFSGAGAGFAQGLASVQYNGEGFVTDPGTVQQRIEMLPSENPGVPPRSVFIHEILLTPVASGRVSISAQGYSIGNRFNGAIVLSSGGTVLPGIGPQYTLLDSEPVDLFVRPLPRLGQLPGFKGAVGKFSLEPPRLSTNWVKVGDALKLAVTVRGENGLARLVQPAPPRDKHWQIFSVPQDNVPPQVQHFQGFATFNYMLVPLTENATATPSIPFSYFDPGTAKFVDLTIPSVAVKIVGGGAPKSLIDLREKAFLAEPVEETLTLSDLSADPGRAVASLVPLQQKAWFPLLHAVPLLGFLGLWTWDRRRRYLEAHPKILEHRRARRELKQHWQTAQSVAGGGDSASYARSVVNALRAGCAPFFPAIPRALVGADILKVLPKAVANPHQNELVRRLFDLADAAQYSEAAPELRELLARRGDYDAVLGELEERLRA